MSPDDVLGLPLSFAQERLWFLDQLQPGSPAYTVFDAVRLDGPLDTEALRDALTELVRRHEVLRSTFPAVAGQPVQVVEPARPLLLPVTDLRGFAADQQHILDRELQAEAARPLSLTEIPVLRAGLFRLADDAHVLSLAVHHIAYDAWSDRVLRTELAELYRAYRWGLPPSLPEPALQFADYAIWQRELLTGPTLQRELDFWRAELQDAPQLLDLPLDRPRPTVQRFCGAQHAFTVDPELEHAVRRLARAQGVTLNMVLLAAFQSLLARYCGQSTVLVGTPVANRDRVELEQLIGFFTNTLVLRVDLTPNITGVDLLQQVRDRSLAALAHQNLPFERLVEELAPARETSHQPIFQVMFALQNAASGGLELDGLRVSPVPVDRGTTMFDLLLYVDEQPDGLHPLFQYNTDLFDTATVARMAGHYKTLLAGLADDPQQPVGGIELRTAAEQAEMDVWSRTAGECGMAADRPVHLLAHDQALRTPDAVAVRFRDTELSYAEFDRRSTQLAHRLQRLGVGPDSRVAICLERSFELVIAIHGVWRAGGAYVPLDPDHPAQRLAYMTGDADPAVILCQRRLLSRLPAHQAQVLCLDDAEDTVDAVAGENTMDAGHAGMVPDTLPEIDLRPGNLAYVIYTSGSTGRPKGVMVDHAGLTNRLRWMQDAYGLTATDRLLQKTPFSFDVSVWEFVWPLLVGATLVVAEPGGHTDPRYLADLVQRERISTVHFVPPMLDAFLDEPDLERRCASLRRVFCSGEALSPQLRDRFQQALPAELHNEYGPTETGEITAHRCDATTGSVPIGRPIPSTATYVVDHWLHPVPIGVPGELLLGGVALARGYHRQPGLTADRYLPNPFDPGGSRLYRTGDLCRWLPDGTLDYLGRIDNQLKIRGFRVEPGEIEAALLAHPEIHQAAVVARRDGPGDPRLVAYLVAEDVDPIAIRGQLALTLPHYMIPTAYVRLDALPLTSSGKLDRGALPAPAPASTEDASRVLPLTQTEKTLAAIWCDVLGLEQIGVHDNFFALGGHSLLASRVVARTRKAVGADLPLRAMFEQPTVAGIAALLAAATTGDRSAPTCSPQAAPRIPVRLSSAAPQPLSYAQSRVWFLDQLVPGSAAYSIVDVRQLSGGLDIRALELALTEVLRRHQALRTSVTVVSGTPHQVVAPAGPVELPVTPLDRSELAEALRQEASQPIPMDSGQLLRARLWRLAEHEHVLSLAVHHCAFDEWSLDTVHAELSALYAAFTAGRPSPLPEPALQYGDFAAWQRGQLDSGALRPQLDYWVAALENTPELLELPVDHPRPAVQRYHGGRLRFDLDPHLVERLSELARRHETTPFMTYLAAFQALLHRLSGQQTILVGTPIANRPRLELEPVVGLFANTLVMRADFAAAPSFTALLNQVKERALGAFTNQDLPYERLVEELAPPREASHNPVFQVMFGYQSAGGSRLDLTGLVAEPLEVENGTAKFDLTLDVFDLGDGRLQAEFEYNSDLFEPATVARFAGQIQQLVAGLVSDPERSIDRLELLSPEEAATERRWSTGAPAPRFTRPVHAAVADWAQRTPAAIAVRWDGGELSYAQLDARADVLAAELQRRGAGPESVVATCLPRGPELVIAELGILRAGAAYLPLDTDNPVERMAFMCHDAGARLVVTAGSWAHRVPTELPTVRVDAFAEDGAKPAAVAVHHRNLAYVIYTSGSTGRPKGVMVEHHSLANVVAWRSRRAGLQQGDRTAMIASPGFDASVTDVWPALSVGGCICVPDQETRLTPARLQSWLLDNAVTVTEIATPLAELLLELPWPTQAALRLLITGGDRLHVRPHPTLPFRLLNEYGPTENTCTSTAGEVGWLGEASGLPSIGGPIDGTAAQVVDPWFQLRPLGAAGELLLGGAGVVRGYLGRPDLTAERFLPDPYAAEPGGRAYASGDSVRRLPDGQLDFLGRRDGQVKIRGFRIELGEITAALRSHPAVSDAAVTVRSESPAGSSLLVGYVVPAAAGQAPSTAELRAWLARDLPAYMVPARYVTLAALPLNRNGKVDERALPAPDRRSGADQIIAPAAGMESRLVDIWCEVLTTDRVGVEDNFFDLGGHSLLLAQVHGKVLEALGRPLPLIALFEHPTIRALARHLEGAAPVAAPPSDRGAQLRAGRSRLNRRSAVTNSAILTPARTVQGAMTDVR